ncbi:hypothetical protein V1520DRAFT_274786 [Lipomyces starkeyi]|uniref:Uncharacterized protein n=1 Tax=Lipomyces starkeyi NRRL Y-11557 TaxID=675824 RepID=A0A1E3QCL2_LIPST|nr:hypothetical protein LIPSTDRAFT_69381 [Lipomyces starkeyi NRRL Y-11557]
MRLPQGQEYRRRNGTSVEITNFVSWVWSAGLAFGVLGVPEAEIPLPIRRCSNQIHITPIGLLLLSIMFSPDASLANKVSDTAGRRH